MTTEQEIRDIDKKLADMRSRYAIASPGMKEWLKRGAMFLKAKKIQLEQKLAEEKGAKEQLGIF